MNLQALFLMHYDPLSGCFLFFFYLYFLKCFISLAMTQFCSNFIFTVLTYDFFFFCSRANNLNLSVKIRMKRKIQIFRNFEIGVLLLG